MSTRLPRRRSDRRGSSDRQPNDPHNEQQRGGASDDDIDPSTMTPSDPTGTMCHPDGPCSEQLGNHEEDERVVAECLDDVPADQMPRRPRHTAPGARDTRAVGESADRRTGVRWIDRRQRESRDERDREQGTASQSGLRRECCGHDVEATRPMMRKTNRNTTPMIIRTVEMIPRIRPA